MPPGDRLLSEKFPRASQYHPEWVLANASGGANSLWLTEWLAPALDLRPDMRVLDLGCGRASSSIFLRRESGAQGPAPTARCRMRRGLAPAPSAGKAPRTPDDAGRASATLAGCLFPACSLAA